MKKMLIFVILIAAVQGLNAQQPPVIPSCNTDADCKAEGENLTCKHKKVCVDDYNGGVIFNPENDQPFPCNEHSDCTGRNEECASRGFCESTSGSTL